MGDRGVVAMGWRVHSGWAALSVVGGSPGTPEVLLRRRVDLANEHDDRSKQPYHAARQLDLARAQELITVAEHEAKLLATRAFREILQAMRGSGREVVACGILLGSGRPATSLSATLASHAMIHTAEGELFRRALIAAAQQFKLPVAGVKERELFNYLASELRISANKVQELLAELGRQLGPPWRQDEKYAALVGWVALARTSSAKTLRAAS